MITFGKTTEEAARAPFLLKTQELESAGISFTVALPVFGEAGSAVIAGTDRKIQDLLRKCTPISPDYENAYEILFEEYVFHMTRDESYASPDPSEVMRGDYFLLFDQSWLLDHLSHFVVVGYVDAYYPNGYQHYGIYCQNHVIDIIATKAPVIRKVSIES